MGYNSSGNMNFYANSQNDTATNYTGNNTDWHHYLIQGSGSGTNYHFEDGVYRGSYTNNSATLFGVSATFLQIGGRTGSAGEFFRGYLDELRISNIHRVTNSASGNFTPETAQYVADVNTFALLHMDTTDLIDSSVTNTTVNATGNFIGNTITASSTTKMGGIITYEDTFGTNALNTDIILQLSADNGSNYSTATLTALPNLSTGIKMAKVNDLSVTAGTQLKYKISFANQSLGSKEARIRGVSLQY